MRVAASCFETGAPGAAFGHVNCWRFCQWEVKVTETASRGEGRGLRTFYVLSDTTCRLSRANARSAFFFLLSTAKQKRTFAFAHPAHSEVCSDVKSRRHTQNLIWIRQQPCQKTTIVGVLVTWGELETSVLQCRWSCCCCQRCLYREEGREI